MGLFAPKLPVSPDERAWVDERLEWLAEAFAEELPSRLPQPIVLPTNEYFPDDYDGTEATLPPVFRRVCGYMGVAPESVRLVVESDPREEVAWQPHLPRPVPGKRAAGNYWAPDESGLHEIHVLSSSLRDPVIAIAVLAHELGHGRLLGEQRLTRDEPDHEPLTDLLTVYLGMGVFTSRAAFQFQQHSGGWSTRRLGYLPETVFGYAIARCVLLRGEAPPMPAWARQHLSRNVTAYCDQSMRCLMRERSRSGR